MSKSSRVRDDRPADSKRDPRKRQRDDQRKAARRAKYAIQGRTR